MADRVNIDRLMQVMSDILSDKYDVQFTITARPKDSVVKEEGAA